MYLNDQLLWRYATKKFDPSKKVSPDQLEDLLESVRLSASSYGLQPYKVIVVTDEAVRKKIRAASWDQAQVTDASHLVIFAANTSVSEQFIDAYIKNIAQTRGMTEEALQGFREMMVGSSKRMSQEEQKIWSQRQSYIGLGTLLAAAALATVDACPMEGFDAATIDEILDLKKLGLTASAFCAIGYRAEDDTAAAYKKVRRSRADFIIER